LLKNTLEVVPLSLIERKEKSSGLLCIPSFVKLSGIFIQWALPFQAIEIL